MKKFEFPLDSVLRWRRTMAEVRKAEAMNCARAVAAAESKVAQLERERAEAAVQLTRQTDGRALAAYSAYSERSRRDIAQAKARVTQARSVLDVARAKLVQADRDVRLIEKLKEDRLAEWSAASAREIEDFAAESFLNRMR